MHLRSYLNFKYRFSIFVYTRFLVGFVSSGTFFLVLETVNTKRKICCKFVSEIHILPGKQISRSSKREVVGPTQFLIPSLCLLTL